MNKKYFIFILVLVLGCSKIKNHFVSEKVSSDSLAYYMRLYNIEKTSELEKKVAIGKAYKLIVNLSNTQKNRDSLFSITFKYYKTKDWKNFNTASNVLLKNALSENDTLNIIKTYRYKAGYFKNTQVFDSSFYYYLKTEKLCLKFNDKPNLAAVLFNKGIVQYYVGDYLGSDLSLSLSYNIIKNSDDYQTQYGTLNQLGLVSNELRDYNKATDYFNQALKIVRKHNLKTSEFQEVVCLSNLGYTNQSKGDYKNAIYYYKESLLDSDLKNGNPSQYSIVIDNLAYSKLLLKDYNQLPYLFFKSLKISDSIQNTTNIVKSNIHLSEYYSKINDTLLSIEYINKALLLAKKSNTPIDFLSALKQSAEVDKKNASQYTSDYIRINDSLQQVERKSKDHFARIQLETDEIIQENGELQKINRNVILLLAGSAILFSLIFIIRHQRMKNRELVYKQEQQRANEEIFNLMISQQTVIDRERVKEKKRISQELHDGVLGRMFGTRLNLDSLNNRDDDEAIRNRLAYIAELKSIEQDIREISHDLNREKYVLINNFVAIVNNLFEEQETSFSPKVSASIDPTINWNLVANDVKINLFRIMQESLQNINKYAVAKSIKISLKEKSKNLVLVITDDGKGFVINKNFKGIGINNMISRTNDCNGIFDVRSEINKGTTISVTIPISLPEEPKPITT